MTINVRTLDNKFNACDALRQLDSLFTKREAWQIQYENSTAELLPLLSGCYDTFKAIKGQRAEKKFIEVAREKIETRINKKVTDKSVMSLIVRYVFDRDGRRINNYIRTLKAAHEEKISAGGFIDWVAGIGELEDIIFVKGVTYQTKKKRFELDGKIKELDDYFAELLEEPVATFQVNPLPLGNNDDELILLLGKADGNGVINVLTAIPNASDGMIDSAKRKIAEALIEHEVFLVKQKVKGAVKKASAKALESATIYKEVSNVA